MLISKEIQQLKGIMAVIKGKEKVLKKKVLAGRHGMTAKAKKILSRPQDTQPIATVAV
jgi:hypothetical protein